MFSNRSQRSITRSGLSDHHQSSPETNFVSSQPEPETAELYLRSYIYPYYQVVDRLPIVYPGSKKSLPRAALVNRSNYADLF